jgi:hypothetical protein
MAVFRSAPFIEYHCLQDHGPQHACSQRANLVRSRDVFLRRSSLHAALLRDVRFYFYRLSVRVPAVAHRAVSHPRSRWVDVRVRPLSWLSDLFVGVFGARDRRLCGPRRPAANPDRRQHRARRVLGGVRRHCGLPVAAGARAGARHLLVRLAVGFGGVHDAHAAGTEARRRHRILGTLHARRRRRVAYDWILDLSPRLAVALHVRRRAERHHGGDRLESA